MLIGFEKLEQKLENLSALDLKTGVGKAISQVQQDAKARCPVNHGELRQSIYTDIELEGDTCRGICYTNKKYAAFVEFGTGPNGQKSHEGISPNIDWAYSQTGWTIPADAMSISEAERYGMGIATDAKGDVIGYYTNGQAAHPFMYPALKDNVDNLKEIIVNSLRSQL